LVQVCVGGDSGEVGLEEGPEPHPARKIVPASMATQQEQIRFTDLSGMLPPQNRGMAILAMTFVAWPSWP